MWKECGHNHQTMESFPHLAYGLFSPHKLSLIGSVSIQPLIIARNKGYFSVMAIFIFIL